MRQYYRVWCGLLLPVTVMLGESKGWGLTAIDRSSQPSETTAETSSFIAINPNSSEPSQASLPAACKVGMSDPHGSQADQSIAVQEIFAAADGQPEKSGEVTQGNTALIPEQIAARLGRNRDSFEVGNPKINYGDSQFTLNFKGKTVLDQQEIKERLGSNQALFQTLKAQKNSVAKGEAVSNDSLEQKLREVLNGMYRDAGYITSQVTVKLDTSVGGNLAFDVYPVEGQLKEIVPIGIRLSRNQSQPNGEQQQKPQPGETQQAVFQENRYELDQRFKTYLCQRIRLGAGSPLNVNKIEDQLRLLRENAAFNSVEAVLKEMNLGQCQTDFLDQLLLEKLDNHKDSLGRKVVLWASKGQSCLEAKVVEAKPFAGSVGIDNNSPPSVGSVRIGGDLRHRSNWLGVGSEIAAAYYNSTTGGNQLWDVGYRVPVNPMNGTLQLRFASNQNRITQSDFRFLDIQGRSTIYEVNYRQPLFVRTPRDEFALGLGFTAQNGRVFSAEELLNPFLAGPGADKNGETRTSVIKFTQEYLHRSSRSALVLRSQFNFGTDWFGATQNEGAIADGQFFGWNGQLQWLRKWDVRNVMLAQAELQLAPQGLLPSQQFAIGGAQSVRGYRRNARAGDNGFRVSLENRFALWDRDLARKWRDRRGYLADEVKAQLYKQDIPEDLGCQSVPWDYSWYLNPFIDAGGVWNNSDNPNKILGNRIFASAGLGLLVEARPLTNQRECQPAWSLRLDYGVPLVQLEGRGNDLQDHGFYFTFRINF